MKKRPAYRPLLRTLLLLAAMLALTLCAAAGEDAYLDSVLAQLRTPKVLDSGTFVYEGQTYNRLPVPEYIVERYSSPTFAIQPGESHERVYEVKNTLYSELGAYHDNEYVTYTQMRHDPDEDPGTPEPVALLFDEHLATFLETLYLFCGLEDKEPCIDDLTCYLLDRLPNASAAMQHDIEVVYKHKLTYSGTQGTLGRDGSLDNLYYFAQTDPDWADHPFPYLNNETMRDRGCGCCCAAMVISTYHKVEITPRWMKDYALAGNWPVDYGLPNDYFPAMARMYYYLETERYGTVLKDPAIIPKAQVDMAELADDIGEKGYLAVIHVKAGAFTSQEHYMVLADHEVIDGKSYFLVADPYVLQSRYRDWDQLLPPDTTNEGLIYATADVLYRDCVSVILFEQDRNEFPLSCKTAAPEIDWLQ